ncbi:hypothetical protein AB0C07_34635 [Actinoplanes missouriensis]|uniref:hypothetical protein n=1 Tax=Actinoplanes missouriensis TaxID=1866 RepID=UPI0033F53F0A
MLSSLLGNAACGYLLAWTSRRRLAAVLLPVLAVALITLTALDVIIGGPDTIIVNGVLRLPDAGVWRLVAIAAFWLVALAAAALVTIGQLRGYAVRPSRALRSALRSLPIIALGVAAVTGGTLLGVRWVAGTTGGRTGLVLVLAVLLGGGVIGARILVGLPAQPLGGPSGWSVTRGRVTATAGAFVLGGAAVPLFFAAITPPLPDPVPAVLGALGATVVVAVQAGILAHVCLLPRDETVPAAAGIDARLAALAGAHALPAADPPARSLAAADPRARFLPWAGAAAALLGLLAPAAAAVVNPFHVPSVRSHGDAGSVAALAWPAGGHPVIATWSGARFCDDDVCDRYTEQTGGPTVIDQTGAAGISADGTTVVKAMVSGGRDGGGPFIHYARCTRDGCPEAWVPVRASAREVFDWPELGVAVGPDRAVWFVLAHPAAAAYRMTFVRCPVGGCDRPQRYEAGTVERLAGDDVYPAVPRVRLTVGADGRPVATVRTGSALVSVSPDGRARGESAGFISPAVSAWAPPATPGGPAVSYEPGQLRVGEQLLNLPGGRLAPGSGAVAASGPAVYVTAAEEAPRPGLHLTVGERPDPEAPGGGEHWRQVLWRCDQSRCARQALDDVDRVEGPEAMVAAADGRVLIVRRDRTLLVSPARDTPAT